MHLAMEDYGRFQSLIYQRTGIFFEDKKIYFVKKRLEERMKALSLDDPTEYFRVLRFSDPGEAEFQRFVNALTTNETYFFREFPQLETFAERCLPEICERRRLEGSNQIRVWSAGCSTGEEPYTLAVILMEMLDDPRGWDFMVTATDIDTNVLNTAKRGVYGSRSVKDVPPEYLARHFIRSGETWTVNPAVRRHVDFRHLNLMDPPKLRTLDRFDAIFCRNVLIYFDDDSRRQVVESFYNRLLPGGFLFLGHSESVSRISSAFKLRRFSSQELVYHR